MESLLWPENPCVECLFELEWHIPRPKKSLTGTENLHLLGIAPKEVMASQNRQWPCRLPGLVLPIDDDHIFRWMQGTFQALFLDEHVLPSLFPRSDSIL
jgi:hypothetical protein